MYDYAQPRALSATALLYLAAALRSMAQSARAAAVRLDEWTNADDSSTDCACESCSVDAEETRELDGLSDLNAHLLKDIGAPHWLVAHAAGERDREHLRWIGFDHR